MKTKKKNEEEHGTEEKLARREDTSSFLKNAHSSWPHIVNMQESHSVSFSMLTTLPDYKELKQPLMIILQFLEATERTNSWWEGHISHSAFLERIHASCWVQNEAVIHNPLWAENQQEGFLNTSPEILLHLRVHSSKWLIALGRRDWSSCVRWGWAHALHCELMERHSVGREPMLTQEVFSTQTPRHTSKTPVDHEVMRFPRERRHSNPPLSLSTRSSTFGLTAWKKWGGVGGTKEAQPA